MTYKTYELNDKQITLLKVLYKFRFATNQLIAEYLHKTRSTINESMLILHDRGLVDRHYSKDSIIDRKPATYFLTPKGVKALKSSIQLHEGVIRSYYKNKTVSENFIQHNITVFAAVIHLKAHYPKRFSILTKAEMAGYEQFPPTKPDLFLQDASSKQYFLYIYQDSPAWVIQKQITQLLAHAEDEEWRYIYPDILVACPNSKVEYKLNQFLEGRLEDSNFLLTTTKAFFTDNTEIWTNPIESEITLSLK